LAKNDRAKKMRKSKSGNTIDFNAFRTRPLQKLKQFHHTFPPVFSHFQGGFRQEAPRGLFWKKNHLKTQVFDKRKSSLEKKLIPTGLETLTFEI